MQRKKRLVRSPNIHPYRKLAGYLYDHLVKDDRHLPLTPELNALSAGKKGAVRAYYIRKTADVLLIVTVMAAVSLASVLYFSSQDHTVTSNILIRPGYGEDDLEEELNLSVPGEEESESLTVHISSRKYTGKEVQTLLKKAEKQLQEQICGENPSLDEVRTPLRFPDTFEDGQIEAEYSVIPSEMVDENGAIIGAPDKEGTPVTIEVTFRLQGRERTVKMGAVIFPPILSSEEQFREDLQKQLTAADQKDPASETVLLPQEAEGRPLYWQYPKGSGLTLILTLSILLPVLFWIRKDEEVKQKAAERKERLELDYSELLFKLTLLLGAGLTIKGAFVRIFHQNQSADKALHPVYEEVHFMLREISGGVAEGTAYENFGRRCSLPQYIKLGSLLAQNLRKGSKGLTVLLEKEAFLSLQQHRTSARKMGEKASMKMLFPMILMFADVIIILMVPALLNM